MTSIGMLIQEGYQPRSPALWEKIFPHVGEEGNGVIIFHDKEHVSKYDACIIASPFKKEFGGNLVYDCGIRANTDFDGFARVKPWIPKDARILVLGTGYLASTITNYLYQCGYDYIYVWGRGIGKALKMANEYKAFIVPTARPHYKWFEIVFNCIPPNQTLNMEFLYEGNKVINLVWGRDADKLAVWQAAYAQHLVYPDYSVEQFHEWMTV